MMKKKGDIQFNPALNISSLKNRLRWNAVPRDHVLCHNACFWAPKKYDHCYGWISQIQITNYFIFNWERWANIRVKSYRSRIEINSAQVFKIWKMWNWNTIRNKFCSCPRNVVKYETFLLLSVFEQNIHTFTLVFHICFEIWNPPFM